MPNRIASCILKLLLISLLLSPSAAVAAESIGVPRIAVDYEQDVRTWWAGHRFNPHSPGHRPAIASPEPVIDVAEVHARHPQSESAGIEEALALLPEAGGTLYFPKAHGPYVVTKQPFDARNRYKGFAPVQILRRSNIHFLSDGATIRGKSFLRISSQEFADHRTEDNPVRNFYFKNITFDADGDANAVSAEGVRDVVFDDCRFVNLGRETRNYGRGAVYQISMSDNWWFRRCHFEGGGRWGWFADGTHGSGLIDCTFDGDANAAVMIFTNDDVNRRWSGYVVVYNCTFRGPYQDAVIGMAAQKSLFLCNTVHGPVRVFIRNDGKQALYDHKYDYSGNQIVGNTLLDVKFALRIQGALELLLPYTIGEYTVVGNRITNMEQPVWEDIRAEGHTVRGPNTVEDNGPDVDVSRYCPNRRAD
jgi:hypothetical protein